MFVLSEVQYVGLDGVVCLVSRRRWWGSIERVLSAATLLGGGGVDGVDGVECARC